MTSRYIMVFLYNTIKSKYICIILPCAKQYVFNKKSESAHWKYPMIDLIKLLIRIPV